MKNNAKENIISKDKQHLLSKYNQIIKLQPELAKLMGETAVAKIETKAELEKRKENLANERFLVSFSGQIKAGKSTLINALLFSKQLLPADDLPHTAKITIIEYADAPSFKVVFYNQKEWNELKEQKCSEKDNKKIGISDNYFQEYLAKEVNESEEQELGISNRLIQKESKEQVVKDLDQLPRYVAKGGLFNPFVNEVTVYYPSDFLKEISVVDTPGINDPNKFRSQVTKNWIDKADANIYIVYANQAMDKTDAEFIDEYLQHLPLSNRIVAVNKIDTVSSISEVKNWLKEAMGNRKIADENATAYVSGLGALIDKMGDAAVEEDKSLLWHAERLEEEGYLEEHKHGLQKFENLIIDRMVKNKWSMIKGAHEGFFKDFFIQPKNAWEKTKAEAEGKLDTLSKDENAIKRQEQELLQQLQDVDQIQARAIAELNKIKNAAHKDFRNQLQSITKNILSNIVTKIDELSNIGSFRGEIPWIIKNAIEGSQEEIEEAGYKEVTNIEDALKKFMHDLKNRMKDYGTIRPSLWDCTIDVILDNSQKSLRGEVSKTFNEEFINDLIKNNTGFWQRFFGTSNALSKVRQIFKREIEGYIKDTFIRTISDSFADGTGKELNNIRGDVRGKTQDVIESKNKEVTQALTALKQGKGAQLEHEKLETRKQISRLRAGLATIEQLRRKIASTTPG